MSKIVLITGGSGGIGKQTAISLAKEGFNVIITGRSQRSCSDALLEIKSKSGSDSIDFIISDFDSLKSVQNLALEYIQKFDKLDILINNVGSLLENKEITNDGLEKSFFINVLTPYLLSNLLFDLLAKSSTGKIISLSGGMHPKEIMFENLQAEQNYLGIVNYSQSKLAMMTLMLAFGKKISTTKVKSNICYPGQASTAMTRALTPQMFPWIFRLFFPILRFANRIDKNNPDKSAQAASKSSVFLALNPYAETLHNSYINFKCKKVKLPSVSINEDYQHKILQYSNTIIKDKLGIDLTKPK